MLRAALRVAVLAALTVFPVPVLAQDVPLQSSVVTLDRTRLFEESLMGRAILARVEAASNELILENRRLEAALEAEERDLTERRATIGAEEFRVLAREFDTRVEELRVAQEAKSRALSRSRDLEQQRFFELAIPVLGGLMQDLGAVAIIDRSAVILSFDRFDITTQAIAALDAEMGDGQAVLDPEPAPEQAPDSDSEPDSAPAPAPEPDPVPSPDLP